MENETVEQLIEAGLPGSKAMVTGDGRHFEAVVVSADFAGKTPLQKQRLVMNTVRKQIDNDELHALSIKTLTPEEWESQQ
ncbi:MAG: BolA/IbaG family iron-sulfur metabolism protein [Chromatiaceae bacterium]|nr:BolA/IbaG family iron-sulfur metabolism protein [Gammaproteobacteria bacterium]MCB1872545.1 BolA/IbaG family iron-sulfur metabolism protein [Gammaproteobacteria bacterium]MCB1878594.1 BolA/IbaG family iron-sulfur metabolism protein [Gammaproteobacteria bacterium]MCP5448638.1 BolA/IbaG family iron-sulfur metabolism protein [Chromatiaceae bacterium]